MTDVPKSDDRICRIVLISGSLRKGAVNTAVLSTARALAPAGVEAILFDRLGDLPLFNVDDDHDPLPEPAGFLRATLGLADAVFFSTPEYAGSLPGSFKNLLDWTVGGGLYQLPVGWINPSAYGGSDGTYETLRTVLGFVGADIAENACAKIPVHRSMVGDDGIVTDPAVREVIATAISALAAYAIDRKARKAA